MPSTPLRTTLRSTLLAATAALALASPGLAQFGGDAGLANAFRQDFYRRDLLIFNEVLDLEDWQRPIVEILLEDYAASFEAGLTAMREEISKLRSDVAGEDGQRIMERMLGPLESWEREKTVLRDQFLQNVQTQLSPLQLERWTALERAIRREKDLPQSELSGEGVDLVAVLERIDLSSAVEEAIDPTVTAYELELDAALLARSQRIEALQPEVREAMRAMDFQRGLQVMQQIMAARIEVRAAQERGLEAIAAALPEEQGNEFRREALEIAFPKVYGPNPTIAFIAAAKAIEDLTPEQREGINEIERGYLVQLENINNRLRDLYRTEEPKEPQRRFERILQRQRGEAPARGSSGEPESIRSLRAERETVGRQAREAILALLTPEQTANLPGFSKPSDFSSKNSLGGFQSIPDVNVQGLGSQSGQSEQERRDEAFSPKDRSPKLSSPDAKSNGRDRVLQRPNRQSGGRSPAGSDTPNGQID